MRVMVGIYYLDMEKWLVECTWCKSDGHPAFACPLLKAKDWLGPCPDNAERFKQRTATIRNKGGPPSAVGRGGLPRGQGRGSGALSTHGFMSGTSRT